MSLNENKVIIFGGYDAKSCAEKIRKNYDPSYADIERDPNPPFAQHIMDKGIEKESLIKSMWNELLPEKIFFVDDCDRSDESKKKREKQTIEAMENPKGFIVIWNARLPQDKINGRTGEPDALIFFGKNKKTKKNIWIPVDVKDHKAIDITKSEVVKLKKFKISSLTNPLYSELIEEELPSGKPKKEDAFQLAHYYRMLQNLGYASEEAIGGIIGREGFILWHDLSDPIYKRVKSGNAGISALEYYDLEFNFRMNVAKNALNGVALTTPILKQECESCEFRTACRYELDKELNHISLLPGINSRNIDSYLDNGYTRIDQLASLDYNTAKLVSEGVELEKLLTIKLEESVSKNLSDHTKNHKVLSEFGLTELKDLNKLCKDTLDLALKGAKDLPNMIDKARVKIKGKVCLARGVNFVPIDRAYIEDDIDIEDSDGLVYLIGVLTTIRNKNGRSLNLNQEYHAFQAWTNSDEGERRVFADFWQYISSQRSYAKAHKKGYRAYHFHTHEISNFRRLAEKHEGKEGIPTVEELENFMNSNEFVDMSPLVTKNLIWPLENHTLKTLAKWLRFSWRDDEPGGGNSLSWYNEAISNSDEEVRMLNRKRILDYNHDDVKAQIHIRNWLSDLGEAREPGKKIPKVENLKLPIKRK